MSRRRVDKLEDSLSPKQAVIHWLGEAHAFDSLAAHVDSLIEQPQAVQPFVALPAQVEKAVWEAMRGERPASIKAVMREAVGDTVFLLRLVIGINVHVEETLRVEGLRLAALVWWSRALDAASRLEDEAAVDGRSEWRRGVSTLRAELMGTEQARATTEARYLDGQDCLFPDLAERWRDLCAGADGLSGIAVDDEAQRVAVERIGRVVGIARTDGLDAAGRMSAADAMAHQVGRALA